MEFVLRPITLRDRTMFVRWVMDAKQGCAHQCVSVTTPRGSLQTVIDNLDGRVSWMMRPFNSGLMVDLNRVDDDSELFSGSSTIYVTTLARICGREEFAESLQVAYDAGIHLSEVGELVSEMISLRNSLCGRCLLAYGRYCVVDYLCEGVLTV